MIVSIRVDVDAVAWLPVDCSTVFAFFKEETFAFVREFGKFRKDFCFMIISN